MRAKITIHQLKFLLEYILSEYDSYGPKKEGSKLVFAPIKKRTELDLSGKKTTIPFKNILFPNKKNISEQLNNNKIAFIGIPSCDCSALEIFLKQFPVGILPERKNILLAGIRCRRDRFCFCEKFDLRPDWDLFIDEEKRDFVLYGKKHTKKIFEKLGLKYSNEDKQIEPNSECYDLKELSDIIDDRSEKNEFWENISENCFGCGACTAVCPLCFCTRQQMINQLDGSSKLCLKWDSCFAKEFSEIQNHFDHRPKNSDRLYNWYNHKFVRSQKDNGNILCTGCGRCIEACPANLNTKLIIESLLQKNEE